MQYNLQWTSKTVLPTLENSGFWKEKPKRGSFKQCVFWKQNPKMCTQNCIFWALFPENGLSDGPGFFLEFADEENLNRPHLTQF